MGNSDLLKKIIVTILTIEFARYGFPLIGLALTNMSADLSGWALIGFFTATGIIGLLLMAGVFYGLYKMWSGFGR